MSRPERMAGELEKGLQKLSSTGNTESYSRSMLLHYWGAREKLLLGLELRNPETETLQDQDSLILTFLKLFYAAVTSCEKGMSELDLCEDFMMASGMLQPFLSQDASGNAAVGVPSKAATFDNISELCRGAAAALIGLILYITSMQEPGNVAPDEFVLVLCTLALKSLAQEALRSSYDEQLREQGLDGMACPPLPGQPAAASEEFGAAHLRWLMHWCMAELLSLRSLVHFQVKQEKEHLDSLAGAQKNALMLIKAVPKNPRGHIKFADLSLKLQLPRPALLFLNSGVQVCEEVGEDLLLAEMQYMASCCLPAAGEELPSRPAASAAAADADADADAGPSAAGSDGGSGVPPAPSAARTWRIGSVQELLRSARQAELRALAWVPEALREAAEPLPWKLLFKERLLPEVEKRHGKAAEDAELPTVNFSFVHQGSLELPMGALVVQDAS